MKTALIFGSTGLIGNQLLRKILAADHYQTVRALARRQLDISHEKLEVIEYDFDNPDPEKLQADHVFCCLGTTIRNAGSKKRFRQVDHDFVVETAKFAFDHGATLFSLVSAIGANEKSRIFYNRVKGELENTIRKIGYEAIHIYRPSLLLGKREEFRLGERIGQIFMKALSGITPVSSKAVRGDSVASMMLYHAIHQSRHTLTIENKEIVRFKTSTDEKQS